LLWPHYSQIAPCGSIVAELAAASHVADVSTGNHLSEFAACKLLDDKAVTILAGDFKKKVANRVRAEEPTIGNVAVLAGLHYQVVRNRQDRTAVGEPAADVAVGRDGGTGNVLNGLFDIRVDRRYEDHALAAAAGNLDQSVFGRAADTACLGRLAIKPGFCEVGLQRGKLIRIAGQQAAGLVSRSTGTLPLSSARTIVRGRVARRSTRWATHRIARFETKRCSRIATGIGDDIAQSFTTGNLVLSAADLPKAPAAWRSAEVPAARGSTAAARGSTAATRGSTAATRGSTAAARGSTAAESTAAAKGRARKATPTRPWQPAGIGQAALQTDLLNEFGRLGHALFAGFRGYFGIVIRRIGAETCREYNDGYAAQDDTKSVHRFPPLNSYARLTEQCENESK
jgi:hypothetical protein